MIIAQYICGGLIILLSLILIGIGIYVICKGERNGFLPILLGIMFTSPGVVIITDKPIPTKQDVLDGKAIYQESIHIRNNDTIKTYEIVWKQKN
jgi:hypothetical protein